MFQLLGWAAVGLALAALIGLVGWRARIGAETSSLWSSLMLIVLASLVNALPALMGASEAIRIAGSVTSLALIGVAAVLLVRRWRVS
jgi:hypothetical protein